MKPWTTPKSVQSAYSQSELTGLLYRGWSLAVHLVTYRTYRTYRTNATRQPESEAA